MNINKQYNNNNNLTNKIKFIIVINYLNQKSNYVIKQKILMVNYNSFKIIKKQIINKIMNFNLNKHNKLMNYYNKEYK